MADINRTVKVASGIGVVLGVWLIVAPLALGYGETAPIWNDILVGIVVAIVAGLNLANPIRHSSLSWANVILGIWLLLAPFVLRYGEDYIVSGINRPLWNDVALGILIVVLGWLSATLTTKPGPK